MEKTPLFILALDGTPFTLLQKLIREGIMPNFKKLVEVSTFKQMDSVLPAVSSSAWASFMTGTTPDEHGILGFVDRNPATMEWYVPNAAHLRKKTIWQTLSEQKKRVFVMNVPVTYPPQKINGISICGFLGNDIIKGTYPPEIGYLLKARGYKIDADTELAKKNLSDFFDHLISVYEKRVETMWHFYQQEEWDVFMTHIMETDRLHHFFWQYFEQGHAEFKSIFVNFYRMIDVLIGNVVKRISKDSALLMLSDHGFTTLNYEVYLNYWLAENNYLSFNNSPANSLKDIAHDSRVYSLYPGRLYINLRGREKYGCVAPGLEYELLRNDLIQKIQNMRDPDGFPIIEKVLRRGEAYPNASSAESNQLPDLTAIAHRGYDLKGNLQHSKLFDKTVFNGMHTQDDAFVLARNIKIPVERFAIDRLHSTILEFIN